MNSSRPSTTEPLDSFKHATIFHNAKITMFINCEDILKPDPAMVGKHTFQSGSEAAHHLQLHHLVDTLAFCQVKIKLLHTCGSLDLHGEPCLQALWNLGEKLVELYKANGRDARCEKWANRPPRDWLDVDAKVVVHLDD